MTEGPVRDLVTFATALRRRGLTVTPDQVGDMARAFGLVDASRRSQVHAALLSLAVTDPDHLEAFDEEFNRFFLGSAVPEQVDDGQSRILSSRAVKPILRQSGESPATDADSQGGASSRESLLERDFAELSDDELMEARRLVLAMMWQPSDVRTRRWSRAPRGRTPDLRRTLRTSTRPEGDLIQIVNKQRRRRQRPLIVIADISGSMEKYAEMFLVFAHAAQRRLDDVEVFTFSTRLTRVTDGLRRRDVKTALSLVSAAVQDWSGGTMIGDAIAEWNLRWSRRLSRGRPIALILSDGWDCGDPGLLAREMARLSRTVHKVIWLNPLAAHSHYQPATRGMRAALPHVDHLLPAASVLDLRDVVRLLDSMSASSR